MDNERFTRFIDAQEHPEKYTEEELKDILQDGKGLAELKRALMEEKASRADIDVDAEWETFCKEHNSRENVEYGGRRAVVDGRKSHALQWYQMAAMFIGVLFMAGITYAAMVNFGVIGNSSNKGKVVAVDSVVAPAVTKRVENKVATDTVMQAIKAKPTTKVYDNATLANILDEMGKFYGVNINFADEGSKSIRLYFEWNQAKSLDENINLLNSFKQIAITRKDKVVTVN